MGKSEVNKCFLWYAWQHGADKKVVVCSITWKAALLLGTEHNPGQSTTRLFGTNTRAGQKRVPGTTAFSRELLHADVRFILHDEVSFDSQKHYAVSRLGPWAACVLQVAAACLVLCIVLCLLYK